ncbi:MOSC domain-containing protein [Burkholderiaceae bacterium DAT-1]|nr:MOSC domain-containing protein [Burkholderiaceae bacterium DAT-1]
MAASVVSVHQLSTHSFSKATVAAITLVAGQGVQGDAHSGETVKHRSRVAKDPSQPNLRQVHLLHSELLDQLYDCGLPVNPGDMGENMTTRGIDLLALSAGTVLRIGNAAVIQVTGLRNPCAQIEKFMPGLLAAVLEKKEDGTLVRKAGVMGIVLQSGTVEPGDAIEIELPSVHLPLAPV